MTTTFRIEEFRLDTSGGPVTHAFGSDLTVLAGPTGVGKTSLLELIKYALGGDGLVASVAEEHVSRVHVTARVGSERLQLSRSIAAEYSNTIEVRDLIEGQRLADHYVARHQPSISDLLMTSLGLPTGLRAAPRSASSTKPGAKITFNDVFRFMYVSQAAINREIAGSSNSYYEPKRRTVFELLFSLTTPELVSLRSDLNVLNSQATEAQAQVATIERFLDDSGTESRIEAEGRFTQAQRNGTQAARELAELSAAMVDVADRETQALRDLLAESERGFTEAQMLVSNLMREQVEYRAERRRVELDVARLDRMLAAGTRIASIEFSTCPRCLQSLDRDVPEGSCRVCLQADVVADLPSSGQYELGQLTAQLEEIDEQLEQMDEAQLRAARASEERQKLVARLTEQVDQRTRERVSPRLQVYADAARRAERSAVEEAALEGVLRQWDRAEDMRSAYEQVERDRATLELRVRALASSETERRAEVLSELTAEFQATVQAFGIPNGQRATINPNTYLPELNGRRFDKVSSAGGIATATQVAYWMSLLAVATRRRDTYYPAFLLIDSPRLALNTAEDMATQMYRRFVTQVEANPGRLQFIVADNELPAKYGRDFTEIDFSIEAPTIGTISHPGPANVQLLVQEEGSEVDAGHAAVADDDPNTLF